MTTAGIFCPQCQVYHPPQDNPSAIPGYCPACGCSLPDMPAPQPSKADGWFFTRDGKPAGPYSVTELRLLAAVGDLKPNDLVWKAGSGPNPSTVAARTLLSGQTNASSSVALPIPTWALEAPHANPKFVPIPGAPLPVIDLAAQPVQQPVRAWVAFLIILALLGGLIGVRMYVESQLPERQPAEKPNALQGVAEGKNGTTRGKRDAAEGEKTTIPAKDAEKPKDAAKVPAKEKGFPKEPPRPSTLDFTPGGRRIPEAPSKLDFSPRPSGKTQLPVPGGPAALAQVLSSPGWATFGQVLPAGAAREALRLGDLPTQTDVKTRWPDGSIRFAVVTARVPRSGTYLLRAAPANVGAALSPTLPAIWVSLSTGGEQKADYSLPVTLKGTGESWLRGPLVYEERQADLLRDAKGVPHPFLRLLLDLRVYQDGQARLDLIVENTLNIRGAAADSYTLWISDNKGNVLTSRSIPEHPYLTRWRLTYPLGLQAAQVRPDLEPIFQAKALPRYLSLVTPVVNSATGENFEPLQTGDLFGEMTAPGPRPEVAPYPDGTARYLVHRDPRQLRYVLVNGDLAGSWPIHLRKADGTLPTPDEAPQFALDASTPGERLVGNLEARGGLVPDVSSQPSLAYVPYLLTGDRYYAEEMCFWANYALLSPRCFGASSPPNSGTPPVGILSVTGLAWGLRELADAASYLPDSNYLKKGYAHQVESFLRWLDRYAEEFVSPLGTLWHNQHPENRKQPRRVWIAPWEQNNLAWSIDHANQQGFAHGLKHRDRIARFQVSLFQGGSAFRREWAAPELLAIGDRHPGGKVALYTNLAEVYRKNFADSTEKGVQFAGSHGPGARLMCLIGIEQGWPGAKAAYAYLWPLIGVEPYEDNLPDLAARAGWALGPAPAFPKNLTPAVKASKR